MFSNANASTSSKSRSQHRKQLGKFSSSVERQNINNDINKNLNIGSTSPKVLIQNFLENANQKNFGYIISPSKREHSVDNIFTIHKSYNLANKAETPGINLRKSYDQQKFPRMPSEEPPIQ